MTKPHYLHIVTVGTSLLVSTGWTKGQPLPTKKSLYDHLASNPRRYSAELNAMIPFINQGQCTQAHLLTTDSPECRLCREAIGQFLHNQKIQTNHVNATGLLSGNIGQAADSDSFYQAIRQFRDAVFRVARKARRFNGTVLINATGGLKAETTVATLVAAELQLSAYYIHESMTEPVFLPTAPLDPDVLAALRNLAKAGRRYTRLAPDLCARLEREGLVKFSRRADGEISYPRLTAYGKSLLQKPANEK